MQPLRDKSNTSCQFLPYVTHLQYLKLLLFAIFTAGKISDFGLLGDNTVEYLRNSFTKTTNVQR